MRALLSIAILSALAVSASAEEKQEVAVLGLEVSGKIDYESTSVAVNLTQELRKQVHGSAKYALAKNSEKELLDEKVAHSCDKEAMECMTKIARKLNVGLLIFGKVFKKKKGDAEGYQLELKLLDVDKKSQRPVSIWIPLEDTSGTAIIRPAARAYKEAVGPDEVDAGTPLPPVERPGAKRGNPGFRPVAYLSGAVMLGAGAVYLYAWQQLEKIDGGKLCTEGPGGADTGAPGCGAPARRNSILTYTMGPLALLAAGVAGYATYKGFISKQESSTPTSSGRRVRKRNGFALTPIVSPDGAGATVRFDW